MHVLAKSDRPGGPMTNALKNQKTPYDSVKPDVQLAKQEESILDFWDKEQIFQRTLDPQGKKPTASMTVLLCDRPSSLWTLTCGSLERHCASLLDNERLHRASPFWLGRHGLPVEYEINKAHKLKVAKMFSKWELLITTMPAARL